ncbi:MAG: deoxyribose-phosphate aldolase [Candidatus Bathyarchaeia archaeon]
MFKTITKQELARAIDHTLVKPNATRHEIIQVCDEAKKYGFGAVCVNPFYVKLVADYLRETDTKVCSTIGFPFGSCLTDTKAFEARKAIEDGAKELDMVMNLGALKSKDYEFVNQDMVAVVRVAKKFDAKVKVIIECCYLSDDEKVKTCLIAKEAKVDYIKTSTGFGPSGARVHDVKLIKRVVGESMGIKASGGIRTTDQALRMMKAGATRIGTSSGVEIIEGLK